MTLGWRREESPVWDADKKRIVGGAPEGVFPVTAADGEALPGDWFAASDGGTVVGYGWLDVTWGGDAEVVFVVAPDRQNQGVGSFIMTSIEREAAGRGINYVYNTVPQAHPDRQAVSDWLFSRGYKGSDADEHLRKRVSADAEFEAPPTRGEPPTEIPSDSRPPGQEDAGGYVDTEKHQY